METRERQVSAPAGARFRALALVGVGMAQALPFARAEPNVQLVVLDSTYVAYERDVADVNLDGANDVVCVSEAETHIRAFLAPDWRSVVLATPTGSYAWPRADDVKASDLDGDGDADLVVRLGPAQNSDAAGVAAWFENRSPADWVQHVIGPSSGYVKDICVADLDGDAKLDVAMRQDAETQLYFQEVSGWTTVTLPHQPHEGMEVADLDGDGRPDIVLNGFWFPTPGTPAAARSASNYTNVTIDAAWYSQTGDWTANSCKVVVGDFDGDSRADVAFSHSERPGHAVAWYRSTTPRVGGSWVSRAVETVDYCHNLQAVDWDLDGDTDLLVGGMTSSQHRGLKVLLNGADGTAWSPFVVQTEGSYSAELGDIDNDGDADIVGIRDWNAAPSYIYRNNAGGGPSLDFWRHVPVTAQHVRAFGLCFPDVEGDGDLDIASGPYVYRNPGPPLTGTWERVSLPLAVHAFATLDVDGDASADLLALQDNPAQNRIDLFWTEAADAGGTSWSAPVRIGDVPRSEHAEGFQGSRVAQFIPGGRSEVAVSSMQGIHLFAVPSANPGAGGWPRVLVAANDSDEGIGVADVDADGLLDIVFTSGGAKAVRWARNPGDGTGGWSVFDVGAFPEADWPDRCEAADLNGDGRVDIVATEENAGSSADALACWWEQPQAGPETAGWTRRTIATQFTMNSLDAADLDRDGDTDLVLAEHRGTKRLAAWSNDGSGSFSEHRVSDGRESHLGGRLADLDADGDLDVVSIAYDAPQDLHVWRNDSPAGEASVAKPAIVPAGGVFDEPLDVSLSCSTPGAELWYTLDGSVPTNQPPSFPHPAVPIRVETSVVVTARGFLAGHRPSAVASALFTGPKVRTPVFAPAGGTFAATQTVAIACATTGVTIRCTLDGTDPEETDPVQSGPVVLTATSTLRARAWRAGLAPSDTAVALFTRLSLGPAAHWRLDERFGSLAFDSSGHARTGSVAGAVWTPGVRDNALSFDGDGDRVECGTWDVAGTGLTVTAWVRPAPGFDLDSDGRILSKATGATEQEHWWMLSTTRVGSDLRLRARLKAGGSTVTAIASGGSLPLDAWSHVAFSYDGTALRLFVDGAPVGSVAKAGNLDANPAASVWIGANPPGAYAAFRGWIDDVRVYNLPLDGAAIAAVRDAPQALPEPVILSLTPASADGWWIAVAAEPGHYVRLERTVDLAAPDWRSIVTQALVASPVVLSDTGLPARAFYRLALD